jgi:hypothetical protein
MVFIQRQLGVFKKGLKERLVLALLRNDITNDLAKVVQIIGNEVGQIRPLGVIPTLLRRVQLRRVRWQRLKGEPRRMVFLKIRRCCTMHVPAVPDHDHVTPVVAMQQVEQPNQAGGIDILSLKMEVKRQMMS